MKHIIGIHLRNCLEGAAKVQSLLKAEKFFFEKIKREGWKRKLKLRKRKDGRAKTICFI